MEMYGMAVAKKLENNRKIFKQKFFRQHCTMDFNGYTKKLTTISQDLSSIFIVDNSPAAYRQNPDNAVPIKSWFSEPHDTALLELLPLLDALRFTHDVRQFSVGIFTCIACGDPHSLPPSTPHTPQPHN
ncbi:CTD nuclear envelope phosphatase 1A [Geodia barretti]|nr:CTD nuclear envelope phosphatase 1A [Geodia barretti]